MPNLAGDAHYEPMSYRNEGPHFDGDAHADVESRPSYVFDTGEEAERQRLEAVTAFWDPFTLAQLEETGVGEGWRCLEIGGGTGSVAAWMQQQVGSSGHVVVTDLETRWLQRLAADNLEVLRHDVVADPIEESSFDLIHARLVLVHLPQRNEAIAKLVAALRPGGWLVVDDIDLLTLLVAHPVHPTWSKVLNAALTALESVGLDIAFGRKLPAVLHDAGLGDIDVQGMVMPQRAPEAAPWLLPALEQIRELVISTGLATAAEIDQVTTELGNDASTLWVYPPIIVSARGRK